MNEEKLKTYRTQFGNADLSPKQYSMFKDLVDEIEHWKQTADNLAEEIENLRND